MFNSPFNFYYLFFPSKLYDHNYRNLTFFIINLKSLKIIKFLNFILAPLCCKHPTPSNGIRFGYCCCCVPPYCKFFELCFLPPFCQYLLYICQLFLHLKCAIWSSLPFYVDDHDAWLWSYEGSHNEFCINYHSLSSFISDI